MKISTKILFYYLVIFIFSMSCILLFFVETDKQTIYDKVKQMSLDEVKSISSKMDYIINITDNQSKILISSDTIQGILRDGSEQINFSNQQKMDNYIANFMNFNDNISSIYIFDNYGNKYSVDYLSQSKAITLQNIKKSSWYDKLVKLEGGYLLKLNSGDENSSGSQNYISLIRIINDLNTQKTIGIMVINVSEQYIKDTLYSENLAQQNFILLDENNHNIINANSANNKNLLKYVNYNSNSYSAVQDISNKPYVITQLKNKYDWKVISINLLNGLYTGSKNYDLLLLFAVLINGVLFVVGLIFTSIIITKPIQKLTDAMKEVELGEFKEVNIKTGNDEIGELKNIYNIMIVQIRNLFEDVIEENKRKRKAELDVLQTQIKPHFLYNSLDAISSLVLSRENDLAFNFVKDLGQFYRLFLSNGKEEITINEELAMVTHYLEVQKIRFSGKFTIEVDVDDRVLDIKIPRLTLQPLVENAINHGIRGKIGKSKIIISAYYYEEHIILSIEDDGIGIDDMTMENIKKGVFNGVGLRATIERLNIYYNSLNAMEIQSEKNKGTKIIITIPM